MKSDNMFKKLRLWLIKKLKATPNELIPIVQIINWEFKKQVVNPTIDVGYWDYYNHMIESELYRELQDAHIIKIKSDYNPSTNVITYLAKVGIAQEEESSLDTTQKL